MTAEEREVARKRFSEFMRKYWASLAPKERTRRQRKVLKNLPPPTKQAKANMSRAQKARWARMTPSERKTQIDKMRYLDTPAVRRKKSAYVKAHWDSLTPEQVIKRVTPGLRAIRPSTLGGSALEHRVQDALTAKGMRFKIQVKLDRYILDIFFADAKLAVECDGAYWHNRKSATERDQRRDARLKSLGITTLRLKEEQLNKNFEKCIERVMRLYQKLH